MEKMVDGDHIWVPAVEAELAVATRRLAQLQAEVAVLAAQVETLERIRDFARSEAARSPAAQSEVGGVQTRNLILRVFLGLPPGTQLRTVELHARMRDDYGYARPAATARKAAQRMSARGTLVKVGRGRWRLPTPSDS